MNHQWSPQVSRALQQFSDAAPDAPSLPSVLERNAAHEIVVSRSSTPGPRANRRRLLIACAAVVVIGVVAVAISRTSDDGDKPSPAVTVGPTPSSVGPSPTTVRPTPSPVVPVPTTVGRAPAGIANGWIAFSDQNVLYLARDGEPTRPMNLSGSNRVSGVCPAFSPDGARLLFVREPGMGDFTGPQAELVVVSVGGDGTAAQLTTIPLRTNDACALWAPDGRWAAYASDDHSVWVIDTTTGEVRSVPHDHAVTDIEWRPGTDELTITGDCCNLGGAYHTGGFNGPISIYSVNSDSTRTIPNVEANDITWSPDGATLAFTESGAPESGRSGENGIWLVDADGTNVRQLTTASPQPTDMFGIVWSPRGDVIAYQRNRADGQYVEVVLVAATDDESAHPRGTEWVMPASFTDPGGNPSTLSPDMITWSPDGGKLLYTTHASAGHPAGMIAVPLDSGQPVDVLTAGTELTHFDIEVWWRLSQQWGAEATERDQ